MARVTDAEVKSIIETNIDDISLFIETARTYTDGVLADKQLSDATLKQIELYLSAHFLSLREKQIESEKIGDSSVKYQGKTGMFFESTHYGQTAMQLDLSGTLYDNMKTKVDFELLS